MKVLRNVVLAYLRAVFGSLSNGVQTKLVGKRHKSVCEEASNKERKHSSKDIRWENGKTGRWERCGCVNGVISFSSSPSIALV